MYIGGWAPNTTADDGAIDFGLQFSTKRRVWDAAGLFYRAGKNPDGSAKSSQPYSYPLGIKPGHFVSLGFWLEPQTTSESLAKSPIVKIRAYIEDMGVDGGTPGVEFAKDFDVSAQAGWTMLGTGGTGQFFKRMVTIGQGHNLEGTRSTFFYHASCLEGDYYTTPYGQPSINLVYRALRRPDGSLVLNPSGSYPQSAQVPWSLGTTGNGPVYGYYQHPKDGDYGKGKTWTKSGVVSVKKFYNNTGQWFYSSASIDCQGGAP